MSLTKQLNEVLEGSRAEIPATILDTMSRATADLKATGIENKALQNGKKAPSFTLKNHLGEDRTLEAMLEKGPLVVSFYRGGW
ncbi:alkyl hydroperoxide reductase [Maridesulfovibrio hydrothermalis]|uniref:Alkyl hydroperoxide reductase/ Thiol specific antioxidant/ Mal allergen n=1 Tax=Maridesulfovibrio hydrothermalis AM13 = DSM 14728 TaxID=1121451 RepID=L0RB69_9BACT